tara:strand:- start:552 stop:827 length:276 start_codon:yes stop_codon:yes gene_type:complete
MKSYGVDMNRVISPKLVRLVVSVVVVEVDVVVKVVVVDTQVVVLPIQARALGGVVVHITVELQVPQRADRELIMVMVLAPLLTFLKYQLII